MEFCAIRLPVQLPEEIGNIIADYVQYTGLAVITAGTSTLAHYDETAGINDFIYTVCGDKLISTHTVGGQLVLDIRRYDDKRHHFVHVSALPRGRARGGGSGSGSGSGDVSLYAYQNSIFVTADRVSYVVEMEEPYVAKVLYAEPISINPISCTTEAIVYAIEPGAKKCLIAATLGCLQVYVEVTFETIIVSFFNDGIITEVHPTGLRNINPTDELLISVPEGKSRPQRYDAVLFTAERWTSAGRFIDTTEYIVLFFAKPTTSCL